MLMMSDATGKRAQLALFSSAVASSLISSIATHRRRANRSAPFPRWMELGRTAARLLKCGNIFGETEPGQGRGPRCTEYGACNGKKASFHGNIVWGFSKFAREPRGGSRRDRESTLPLPRARSSLPLPGSPLSQPGRRAGRHSTPLLESSVSRVPSVRPSVHWTDADAIPPVFRQ